MNPTFNYTGYSRILLVTSGNSRRVRPDGLASTILTKCDPHWGAYFHYAQARAFTVREAARIESFPDRFQFLGTMAEQYAQVGNAVPPLLAKAIGEAMKPVLEG